VARVAADPEVAYGSTVLGALVVNDTLVVVQLGDGDILCVRGNGITTRPIPRDERLIANVTTSLCLREAEEEMRVRLVAARAGADYPVLVLLSTDGYANSFRSDTDFLAVGPDVLAHIGERGLAALLDDLPVFLDEASTCGSGDDITVGIMTRAEDGVALAVPEPPASLAGGAPRAANRRPHGVPGAEPAGAPVEMSVDAAPPAPARGAPAGQPKGRRVMVAVGLAALIVLAAATMFASRMRCAPLPFWPAPAACAQPDSTRPHQPKEGKGRSGGTLRYATPPTPGYGRAISLWPMHPVRRLDPVGGGWAAAPRGDGSYGGSGDPQEGGRVSLFNHERRAHLVLHVRLSIG
jgi:hypothetical protein